MSIRDLGKKDTDLGKIGTINYASIDSSKYHINTGIDHLSIGNQ